MAAEEISMFDVNRREFIALLGDAATWPLAAGAGAVRQHRAAMSRLSNYSMK
jgi:hypothetical protein